MVVERGDHVTVLKGTHKNKTGVVTKVHRVMVSIRFSDGDLGRTLPSSLKIIAIPSVDTVASSPSLFGDLEKYRALSVEVLAEMLAQGLALSDKSEEATTGVNTFLRARVKEIRQGQGR